MFTPGKNNDSLMTTHTIAAFDNDLQDETYDVCSTHVVKHSPKKTTV